MRALKFLFNTAAVAGIGYISHVAVVATNQVKDTQDSMKLRLDAMAKNTDQLKNEIDDVKDITRNLLSENAVRCKTTDYSGLSFPITLGERLHIGMHRQVGNCIIRSLADDEPIFESFTHGIDCIITDEETRKSVYDETPDVVFKRKIGGACAVIPGPAK